MAQTNSQRSDEETPATVRRPKTVVKVGNIEIAIWENHNDRGEFYTASAPALRYKDTQSSEWKDGSSYGPMDLLALAEAAREASAKIRELSKTRSQAR